MRLENFIPLPVIFAMNSASLNDAYVEFAAAATELRRKYCNSFASRLDGGFADDASAVWAEVSPKWCFSGGNFPTISSI